MNFITAYMIWQPRLSVFWGGILIVSVVCALFVIYLRIRRRYAGKALLLLIMPKIILALLLLLLFFDPAWAVTRRVTENLRFLLLKDRSSSMEVEDRDESTRLQRARRIAADLVNVLPDAISLETLRFEHYIKAGEPGQDVQEVRPTDLAQVLVEVRHRQAGGDYDGAIFLTDGGDERFRPAQVPPVPLYLLGIGADPGENNDIEISGIDAPRSVELGMNFNVDVTLRSHGEADFRSELFRVDVEMQKLSEETGQWERLNAQRADLRDGWANLTLHVDGLEQERRYTMRILVEERPEEFTHLNNKRKFTVDVEERSLRALLYTQILGQNEAVLRRVLRNDAGIQITSLQRISPDQFVLRSEDDQEDAFLQDGFPESAEDLKGFKTIIVGSFPAEYWTEEQMEALVDFVNGGGSAVFLGGEYSFGRGGYANTPLRPLMPWVIRADEPELIVQRSGVTLTAAIVRQDVIRGWDERMRAAHPLYLHSLNRPGTLRRGAVSLLTASHESEQVPVLAIQPYGLGRVLGVATNTMWRWTRENEESRGAYNHFWSQSIRYLAGIEDGGRFLRVNFDKSRYYPGESAEIDMQVIGDYAEGQLTLDAIREFQQETEKLTVERRPTGVHEFRSRTPFPERGNYIFRFTATVGNEELESYERSMWVGSHLNEGANIYVDHSFLTDLAARTGGTAYREDNIEELAKNLENRLERRHVHGNIPLLQFRGLYLLIIMLTLLGEWIIRRRMDLF